MATAPLENPIAALSHDHKHLTELLIELRALMTTADDESHGEIVDAATRLREELITHFAREEEGLFPFVQVQLPELAPRVDALASGHDRVCGALVRLSHLLGRVSAEPAARAAALDTFRRFEDAYALHARDELGLLAELDQRLDTAARRELRALLDGL